MQIPPRRTSLLSLALVVCVPWASACQSQRAARTTPLGISAELELSEREDRTEIKEKPIPPEDVVEKAARPFTGYRLADAHKYPPEDLLTVIAEADAVCIGEQHDDPLDHFAELRAILGLLERRQMRGYELGVGLEMLRDQYQQPVMDFEKGELNEKQFFQRVDWRTEWGFPQQYYAPQLEAARLGGARLLALGVPRSLTKAIATEGLAGLNESQRRRLPELDLEVAEHRNLFEQLMLGHPLHSDPRQHQEMLEHYYEVQVVWDESMAARSATWLRARQPGRKLIILAGTAHCTWSGIPQRLEDRTGLRVVNLLPVHGGKPIPLGAVQDMDQQIAQGYEFQMVFEQ